MYAAVAIIPATSIPHKRVRYFMAADDTSLTLQSAIFPLWKCKEVYYERYGKVRK